MQKRILVFDPGESTGWVFYDGLNERLYGGTVMYHNHHEVLAKLFSFTGADIVVYEKFMLYPGAAKAMSWNTFVPCEMIGIIKHLAYWEEVPDTVDQAASVRKYISAEEKARAKDMLDEFPFLSDKDCRITKHTMDALMHLVYYCKLKRVSTPWQKS